MYDKYFKRVEEKYLITSKEKEILLDKIKDYIHKDKFFKSEIHNIYFDTDNNDLMVNSLNKPIFKDKIRERSYGNPSIEDDLFFEFKIKYKGVVGKRRIKLKLNDYYDHKPKCDDQIMKEIDYYFKHQFKTRYIYCLW